MTYDQRRRTDVFCQISGPQEKGALPECIGKLVLTIRHVEDDELEEIREVTRRRQASEAPNSSSAVREYSPSLGGDLPDGQWHEFRTHSGATTEFPDAHEAKARQTHHAL